MNSNRVKSVKEEWDEAVKKSLTSISQEQIKEKFLGDRIELRKLYNKWKKEDGTKNIKI